MHMGLRPGWLVRQQPLRSRLRHHWHGGPAEVLF